MSYPSTMPMKATTEIVRKAAPGYAVNFHKSTPRAKYPFKWTVLGLIACCASFWMTMAWLF